MTWAPAQVGAGPKWARGSVGPGPSGPRPRESYFQVCFLWFHLSEWGLSPERDMLSLGVMGMGAGGLRKFFRRRRRRRRRRRPPPKVGFLVKSVSFVLWHIAELWIFWRRHMKATVEAVLLFFSWIREKKSVFSWHIQKCVSQKKNTGVIFWRKKRPCGNTARST